MMCDRCWRTAHIIFFSFRHSSLPSGFIFQMLRLPITEKDMEKEHQRQLAKRRQAKDKSPSRKSKTKTKSSSSMEET